MLKRSLIAAAALAACSPAGATPEVDAAAPAFSGLASNGETISLDDLQGELVVLEWTNDQCPFVQKHYETDNMQLTQKAAHDAGAYWITVISSAPGKQGHVDAARANRLTAERGAEPDWVILDAEGTIGKAYGATATPQMALIDREGVLRYQGAIDDKPSADHATVEGATNYLLAALESVDAGEEVAVKETKSYGCSIKYGS